MEYIRRDLQNIIEKWLFKGKLITIFGARQVGKTTLVKHLLKEHGNEKDYFNCDIISVRQALQSQDPNLLRRYIGYSKFIVIDEAQRISDAGLILKLLYDHFPELQIIATGSSSFELSSKLNEPLTGRAIEFKLFPFSLNELQQKFTFSELDSHVEFFMRYGLYPEITQKNESEAVVLLNNLADKYLYKDILEYEQIKRPDMLVKLLQLLAFQLGNEVSKHELGQQLSLNRATVERYLDLLEKVFIIFRLKSFSRNLRKEISKKEKIYFFDTGIRNSLISRFNPLEFREDKGALFENFCIVERMKYLQRNEFIRKPYFWRTHDKKEIDYIEEYNDQLDGYEFKWQPKKIKAQKDFLATYKNSTYTLISRRQMWDFIL